jgi:hypothetical protein
MGDKIAFLLRARRDTAHYRALSAMGSRPPWVRRAPNRASLYITAPGQKQLLCCPAGETRAAVSVRPSYRRVESPGQRPHSSYTPPAQLSTTPPVRSSAEARATIRPGNRVGS